MDGGVRVREQGSGRWYTLLGVAGITGAHTSLLDGFIRRNTVRSEVSPAIAAPAAPPGLRCRSLARRTLPLLHGLPTSVCRVLLKIHPHQRALTSLVVVMRERGCDVKLAERSSTMARVTSGDDTWQFSASQSARPVVVTSHALADLRTTLIFRRCGGDHCRCDLQGPPPGPRDPSTGS